MGLIIGLINLACQIAHLIIIAQVAIHWLTMFGVVNLNNDTARKIVQKLDEITEPVYSRIRQVIPAIGGIDLTPLVAMIGISLINSLIHKLIT